MAAATWPQGMTEWATQNVMSEWMFRQVIKKAMKELRANETVGEAGKPWKLVGEAGKGESVKEE